MTVDNAETSRASIGARRFGYAIAVGINVLLVVVVNNILSWGWLPWLTPEFEKLLPVINLALVVNIVLNFVYMAYDEPPTKAATQIMVNLIAIVVLVRTLQVIPSTSRHTTSQSTSQPSISPGISWLASS